MLFGNRASGDAGKLLEAIRAAGAAGLATRDQHAVFGRHLSAAALEHLRAPARREPSDRRVQRSDRRPTTRGRRRHHTLRTNEVSEQSPPLFAHRGFVRSFARPHEGPDRMITSRHVEEPAALLELLAVAG